MMVVGEASINNIMGGMESTTGVRLHNHKRKLKQRFDIIKKLGQGTYGKVQLGINKETGQEVAIKTIKKCKIETDADLIRIRREIQIMSSVQHPNIIHIYEVFENKEKMVLVMEYAAGGELYDYLSERKVLPEQEARRIFRQITTAIYYCHKHMICHRDLKLENILLDQMGNAKIADFGLSNIFDDQRLLHTFCGSPLYASPEIVKGTPYHGPEVDCWSLGVLLYTLVYGAMPFDGSNFKRLVKQISQSDYFEPKKPSSATSLIKNMLIVCPSQRANIEKICSHWWINEGYEQNCLEIAENLAAQTPVRLDLLLSLVPQPTSTEKLVVETQQPSLTQLSPSVGKIVHTLPSDVLTPMRCHSIGNFMKLQCSDLQIPKNIEEKKTLANIDSKRKFETTTSTDETIDEFQKKDKTKRKIGNNDKNVTIDQYHIKRHTVPITNLTIREPMEVDTKIDSSVVFNNKIDSKIPELLNFSQEMNCEIKDSTDTNHSTISPNNDGTKNEIINIDKSNRDNEEINSFIERISKDNNNQETVLLQSEEDKIIVNNKEKKKDSKKSIYSKNENLTNGNESTVHVKQKNIKSITDKKKMNKAFSLDFEPTSDTSFKTSTGRRKSTIFETTKKFNQLSSPVELEKPKKIFIPGVNVGGTKLAFEKKANHSSTALSQTTKASASKIIIDVPLLNENQLNKNFEEKKRARDIITGAIGKPPLQKKLEGLPATSANDCTKFDLKTPLSSNTSYDITESTLMTDIKNYSEEEVRSCNKYQTSMSNSSSSNIFTPTKKAKKCSQMEITLKGATLPRPRKTTKAEITLLDTHSLSKDFRSEITAKVDKLKPDKLIKQRSEVTIPVTKISDQVKRGISYEPESNVNLDSFKEHCTPFKRESLSQPSFVQSTSSDKPVTFQRSLSHDLETRSCQSTIESDTDNTFDSTVNLESIKKSQREYIIPIAVEGGGYVTKKLNCNESESKNKTPSSVNLLKAKHNRSQKLGSFLLDTTGDESSFSSIRRDEDDLFHRHMHRLRSSRPSRQMYEYADSVSSGEDDDDDGFELLTAENLFSTLLSRVRSLTQRLNVDDDRISNFSNNGLLGKLNLDSHQGFWGMREPLSRYT